MRFLLDVFAQKRQHPHKHEQHSSRYKDMRYVFLSAHDTQIMAVMKALGHRLHK